MCATMSDYEDIAEQYERVRPAVGGGKKKKAVPTHVGKVRSGGTAWVGNVKACPKGCAKKCCSGSRT